MTALLPKKFYPVIHCIDPREQQGAGHALRNARIAMENGADGIFLIGHRMHFSVLSDLYEYVRKQFPELWIGINFLDISQERNWHGLTAVTKRCIGVNALWIDGMPNEKLALPSEIQVFGGVAFKYIASSLTGPALSAACVHAQERVDVITTSGDKTGSAPHVRKLEELRAIVGPVAPLAIASGVDSDNVSQFLRYGDKFLVASSISRRVRSLGNAEFLVPQMVRELGDKIHQ